MPEMTSAATSLRLVEADGEALCGELVAGGLPTGEADQAGGINEEIHLGGGRSLGLGLARW